MFNNMLILLTDRNDPSSRVGGYGNQENYGASGANPAPSSGHNNTGFTQGNTGYAQDNTGYGQGNTGYGQQGGAGYGQSTGAGYGDSYNSSATPGTGKAGQTAGPHNSNLMNKLDPRVDSDMDGSKTYGGNKTAH